MPLRTHLIGSPGRIGGRVPIDRMTTRHDLPIGWGSGGSSRLRSERAIVCGPIDPKIGQAENYLGCWYRSNVLIDGRLVTEH